MSNTTAASGVTYLFVVRLANQLDSGSTLSFTVPATVKFTSGGTCTQQNQSASCQIVSNKISITLLNSLTAGSNVTVSYNRFINPPNTMTTGTFLFSTFNSATESVDIS